MQSKVKGARLVKRGGHTYVEWDAPKPKPKAARRNDALGLDNAPFYDKRGRRVS